MNLVFVGGGHITRALLGGLATAGRADGVVVVERNADKRRQLEADFNIHTTADMPAARPDAVIIAVRPPQVRATCEQIAGCGAPLFISVAAGLRLDALSTWLAGGKVIRAMPNTPSQVGAGMTFCCAGGGVGEDGRAVAESVFAAAGKVAWLEDEQLLDAATAVSGSGPAYVYYFIEAMRAAAVQMNLPEETALAAVLQTLRGAVAMVEKGENSPDELCRAVAVRGGSTERALAVFDSRDLRAIVAEAMRVCAERAREMGDTPPGDS